MKGGTTVLLTTQYLEEADQLADKIVVIDGGNIIAEGTADELKAQVGGDVVEVVVHDRGQLDAAAMALVVLLQRPAEGRQEGQAPHGAVTSRRIGARRRGPGPRRRAGPHRRHRAFAAPRSTTCS